MEMRNCLRWTVDGVDFEACDFGSFIRVHLPAADGRAARQLLIETGDPWTHTTGKQGETLTFGPASSLVTITAPGIAGTTLSRWLERVSPSMSTPSRIA